MQFTQGRGSLHEAPQGDGGGPDWQAVWNEQDNNGGTGTIEGPRDLGEAFTRSVDRETLSGVSSRQC